MAPALSRMFGESPRSKLVEAVLRLGPIQVTRGQLAAEAGVWRGSANRIIVQMEADGLVQKVKEGKQPLYRANPESAEIDLLSYVSSVLEVLEAARADIGAARELVTVAKSAIGSGTRALLTQAYSGSSQTPLVKLPSTSRCSSDNLSAVSVEIPSALA
jgi:hypothetical protein